MYRAVDEPAPVHPARVIALLAVGVDRWLQRQANQGASVDFPPELSVDADAMPPEQTDPRW